MSGTRISSLLGKITVLFVICCCCLPAQAKYGGGKGEPNDPYLIYTAEQMNEIGLSVNREDWDKCFKLMADIDLSGYTGTSFNIIGIFYNNPFTGVFDGNGHTISNFTYTSAGTNYIGLFGYVSGPDVEIKDLGLIDPNVDAGAGRYVGSLVGRLRTGTITNCYVEGGSVAGDEEVGGLVGTNEGGTITNCYASGSVSGDDYVGGLVGFNHGSCSPGGCSSGMISNCYATSSVTGIDYVGGLVGGNYGTISNCYATGDVAGVDDGIGGLVGYNPYGTISDCYAKGSVKGDDFVGGLVGINSSSSSTMGIGTLNNCYSTGGVLGYANVGGLVGRNWVGGEIINCFWDIETSEQSTSAGGTGKTTAEMQTASTFALVVWGCGSVWTIDEGKDYPRLWWENAPGELITTPSYGGGSGEPNDPYLIYTAEQLNTIGLVPCHFDKHFKLMDDIDLSNFTGTSFNIIGTYWANPFTGVFDGNGHTISNFTCTSYYFIGLFGYVNDPNAEIKNLGLIDPNVDAWGDYVGSLIGLLSGGTITNCYVEGGSVSGNESGGLVGCVGDPFVYGYNDAAGTITNCYSTCSVSGNYCVGGLVGFNSGSVLNCYSTSSVTGKYDRVGGLVGTNEYGKITNCYSTGTVSGGDNVGGLVGLNTGHCVYGPKPPWPPRPDICYFGTISNCYSTGSVTGVWNVGGLVGENSWRDDWGNRHEAEVWASFWDIETSGQDWSAGGTGKTTAELQTASTFYAWACVNDFVWTIDEGKDYPRLWWENAPGKPLSPFSGGSGTQADPYLIYTAEQLNTIGLIPCHLDNHFKLMADIDLSGITGTSFNIIGYFVGEDSPDNKPFTGIFDGNGHTISNFSYTSTGGHCIGLFGYIVGSNAEIKDLGLIDPNVDAGTRWYAGSLVGHLKDGTITNCYAEDGCVSGNLRIGGLVGENDGTITNCYSTGSVSGLFEIGGLVGENNGGTITNCSSTGSVIGTTAVGGPGHGPVGGLVGYNYDGTITNCSSTGSVMGNGDIGGLVGRNYYGIITNCYSTGSVSGYYRVGGLVGYDNSGSYTKSFWDNTVNSGLPGIGNTSDPNVIGESTANMQTQSTFTDAGWDFVGETVNGIEDIWFITQQDYPHLWWEGMRVPMKLTPRTLNCRSKGNWVKAHLTLPQGFTVADVDPDRPAVLHSLGFESAPLYVFVNENERVQIEAAFEREAVCSLAGDWPEALIVAGFFADGNIFLGNSTIRIIHPGMKVIEELAWYWLNGDCVHPTWCDRIDMNRDSLVNMLDYALLMNIEVEFVTDE